MTLVSFFDYAPPPRYDSLPWTNIQIFESTSKDGPWSQIDSFAILPLDTNPAHPAARNFSTDNALLPFGTGWYKVRFVDEASDFVEAEPIQNVEPEASEYLPSLSDVADLLLSRTRDSNGVYQNTFTNDTTPTDEQARRIILKAGDDVRRAIGTDIPDNLRDDARRVVAARAAMMIELSLYSTEVAQQRSSYDDLKDMYNLLIVDLSDSVAAEEAGLSAEDEVSNAFAQFSFPTDSGWLSKEM